MSQCLFCKIVKGEIPCQKVFENENVIAFNDISPSAKVHVLFVHKNHTEHINELVQNDMNQLCEIFQAINTWTRDSNLADKGFRIVNNCGKEGGQTVFHTHFHVLGGQQLSGF